MYALAYDEFNVSAVLQSSIASEYFFKLLNAAARLQYNAGSSGFNRIALDEREREKQTFELSNCTFKE